MHKFEQQQSTQTLAEGIREYFAANPDLAKGRSLSKEAAEFFRCHDAAHVVFGCGNTLDDEAVVKLSSIFGTTAGFQVLKGYRLHESIQIYKSLQVMEVLSSIARSVFLIPRTIFRCKRQRHRWPWRDFDDHLNTPLHQIRSEFGIAVPHRTTVPNVAQTFH